ncbi:MAG: tetratricopeptide repeat protein [Bryobacteraceae bacterium]
MTRRDSPILLKEHALLDHAREDEAHGNLRGAEALYLRGRVLARQLPPEDYHVETDILRALANVHIKEKQLEHAETVYEERLALLLSRRKGIDLDIGIALFDLEVLYDGVGRQQEAERMIERATQFYNECKGDQNLATTCDRRLAYVQGFQGVFLFEHQRSREAEPYLRIVAARPDQGLRPALLESALIALAAIRSRSGDLEEAIQLARRFAIAKQVPRGGADSATEGRAWPSARFSKQPLNYSGRVSRCNMRALPPRLPLS